MQSSVHSYIHTFIHSLIHSLPFIRYRSFAHSFTPSLIHSSQSRAAPRGGLGWTCPPHFPQVGIHSLAKTTSKSSGIPSGHQFYLSSTPLFMGWHRPRSLFKICFLQNTFQNLVLSCHDIVFKVRHHVPLLTLMSVFDSLFSFFLIYGISAWG